MNAIGLDIGYSSVKVALLDSEGNILFTDYRLHRGNITGTLREIMDEISLQWDGEGDLFGALTGQGKELFGSKALFKPNSLTSLVEFARKFHGTAGSIIEMGGQSSRYITLLPDIEVCESIDCSSGTGSFVEEQTSRLNARLEDYSSYLEKATKAPRIAGRCSVFAKTDITHLLQEGESINNILLGLTYSVARSYKANVVKKRNLVEPVLIVGGVMKNSGIVRALKEVLNVGEKGFLIPGNRGCEGAVGAALLALKEKRRVSLKGLLPDPENMAGCEESVSNLASLGSFGQNDSLNKHVIKGDTLPDECYLGIDIGSTSVNFVLTDKEGEICLCRYLKSYGRGVELAGEELSNLRKEIGRSRLAGIGVTGSGRQLAGRLFNADVVRDEITSQARAAVEIDPDVDTVFEIGGQDSKYISIKNGSVVDFQMNKICAAGTGSFIEEQAVKFNIPLDEFSRMALDSDHPAHLGERCTVFIESAMAASLAEGVEMRDLTAGLCYSVAGNYLNKVVGLKKIGSKIFLQGGIAYNQGVVNALRAVSEREIVVPPFFSVTGAYGIALLTLEELSCGKRQDSGKVDVQNQYQGNYTEWVNRIFFGEGNRSSGSGKTIGIPRGLFAYSMYILYRKFFSLLGFRTVLSDLSVHETLERSAETCHEETCLPIKLIHGHIAALIDEKVDYIFLPDIHSVGSRDGIKGFGCSYMQVLSKLVSSAMDLSDSPLLSPTIAYGQDKASRMKPFLEIGKALQIEENRIVEAAGFAFGEAKKLEEIIRDTGREFLENLDPNKKTFVIVSKVYGTTDQVLNVKIPEKLLEMGYQVVPFFFLPEENLPPKYDSLCWPFARRILSAAYEIKKRDNMYGVFLTHYGCGPDSVISHYIPDIMGEKRFLSMEIDEHSSDVGVITRLEAFVNSIEKPNRDIAIPNLYPYSQIIREILLERGLSAEVIPETDSISMHKARKVLSSELCCSITALLGDVLKYTDQRESGADIFIPEYEGSGVEGQCRCLIETFLCKEGKNVNVESNRVDDLINGKWKDIEPFLLGVIAGDIVMMAPPEERDLYLSEISKLIRARHLNTDSIIHLKNDISPGKSSRKILAVGDPFILFNRRLNNNTFNRLEKAGERVLYSPVSEKLLLMWYSNPASDRENLEKFLKMIAGVSVHNREICSFEPDCSTMITNADKKLKYYSGGFGKYRYAKVHSEMPHIDGVITVSSTNDNTGTLLSILVGRDKSRPVLHLTFDGNEKRNNREQVDTFLYYLQGNHQNYKK